MWLYLLNFLKPAEQIFNDPVLGQLAFAPVIFKIIDTRQFQRLRDIKQLGKIFAQLSTLYIQGALCAGVCSLVYTQRI